MNKKILVLGGYGTYGRRITAALTRIPYTECIMGGRNPERAKRIARETGARSVKVDVHDTAALENALQGVYAVINASGVFEAGAYQVARQCARHGIHYIDLADSREYVKKFTQLDQQAKKTGCLLVTGASTVPAVTAALVEHLAGEFDKISAIHTGITMGNQNPRGVAAVKSILAYTGKGIKIKERGRWRRAYGWSESQVIDYPEPVGRRRVFLSDLPDLDLFPQRYGANTVSFRGGLQLPLFNFGLYFLGRLHRGKMVKNLPSWAGVLTYIGKWFGALGDASGGICVQIGGSYVDEEIEHSIFLIARDDNAPAIPCSPATALMRKWIQEGIAEAGARACIGMLSLDEIKQELMDYDIVIVRR